MIKTFCRVQRAKEQAVAERAERRPVLDVAAGYQRAVRQAGASAARPTVVLAVGTARLTWHDDGPAERLVYVVQWRDLMLSPSGPPRRDERPRGPMVGTRTVIVVSSVSRSIVRSRITAARKSFNSGRGRSFQSAGRTLSRCVTAVTASSGVGGR